MRGPLVKNYYSGWLEFLKIVKNFDGTLLILMSEPDLGLWLNYKEGNKVEKIGLGVEVPIDNQLQAVSRMYPTRPRTDARARKHTPACRQAAAEQERA